MLVLATLLALAATLLAAPAAPARAAVPDQWGFAYNDRPNPPAGYVMPVSRQWGSWKAAFPASWATVSQIGVGFYQVKFPHIGGKGVAHVTAVNYGPVSCQLAKWGFSGTDEIVYVRCHTATGAPRDSAFTVLYSESSGLSGAPYGWVWGAAGGGVVNGFNASGAPNSSVPIGVGTYDVRLPGLGGGFDGNVQVTAVHSQTGVRCAVAKWAPSGSDQRVIVRCNNSTTGAPFNTDFTLTYHHKVAVFGGSPTRFGYLWDTFGAIPPGANVNSFGAVNTVVSAGAGLRLVTFPKIGLDQSHVQVTAFSSGGEFCNLLAPWAIIGGDAVVRDVACYTGAGARINTRSFVTYTSRF
jgi:hypothetical protein